MCSPRQIFFLLLSPPQLATFFVRSYPRNYVVHICGVKKAAVANAFAQLVGSDVIRLSTKYENLEGDLEPSNLLPRWSSQGTFDFDLDKYRYYLTSVAEK